MMDFETEMPMSPERKKRRVSSMLDDKDRTRHDSEGPECTGPIPHRIEQLEAMEEGRAGVVEEEVKETRIQMPDADHVFDQCMNDMMERRKTEGKAPMPNWMDLPEKEGCAVLKEFCQKKKVLLHNKQKMFLRSNGEDDIWWSDDDDDDDDDGTVTISKTPDVLQITFS
jgi:hypothetical protein